MSELTQILRKEFRDKESAHIYVKEFLYESIATQIKVLREQRGWTQKVLAAKIGMEQSRISLLENVNYDKWSISTLTKLAEVFDVGLYLSYEKFSKLIDHIDNFSRESLERLSREDDLANEVSFGYLREVVDNTATASSKAEIENHTSIADSDIKEVEENIQVAGF